MNYLDRASKHIVSSHHIKRKSSKTGFLKIFISLLIMVLIYFIGKTYIGNLLFSIRAVFLPAPHNEITLLNGAYESELQAIEIENSRLKFLLEQSGVRVPNFNSSNLDNSNSAPDVEDGNIENSDNNLALSKTNSNSSTSTATSGELSTSSDLVDSLAKEPNQELTNDNSMNHLSTFSRKIKLEDGDVISTVLMRPPLSPYDVLVIDRGQDMGINTGDQVYAWNGFPIGEVVTVYKTRSIVKLLSAPENKIEVYIGTSTTAVTAQGKGGGNFFLKLPKVSNIKKGDMVARKFLSPEVFSTIEYVDSHDGEAYTYAYFKLPINLNNLVYVLVKENITE